MKIGIIEFPAGSGNKFEIARTDEGLDEGGEPYILFRPSADADTYGLSNFAPVLHPDFLAEAERVAGTLEVLGDDEQMDEVAMAEAAHAARRSDKA